MFDIFVISHIMLHFSHYFTFIAWFTILALDNARLPSVREVKDHELQGHLPYLNWCSVCVRATGEGFGPQG